MARDIFTARGTCHYCNRPHRHAYAGDLRSCGHEVCKSLAFAQARRLEQRGNPRV